MKKYVCIVLTLVLVLAACTAYAARWQCERCGSKVDDRMEQCPDCGAVRPRVTATPEPTTHPTPEPTAEPTPEPWKCLVCSALNAGTQTECWRCAYPAGTTPEPTATPEPSLYSQFTVGRYVTFGHYPQTSSGTDNTPIEWLVLARDGNKALLISRYALDCQPYNTEWTEVTWETCTLRQWLNSTFIDKAFTAGEQAGILAITVDNSRSQGNSDWSTYGGNNTQDKVFLLSYADAFKYFKNNDARMCVPTDYAEKQGAWTSSVKNTDKPTGLWWLRSPGSSSSSAAYVHYSGARPNASVTYSNAAVRPALWVNLDSGIF